MRRRFICGNWKMNLNLAQATDLARQIQAGVDAAKPPVDVAVCPAYVYIHSLVQSLKSTSVTVGAQNVYEEEKGAFTGEVAPMMLADVGARWVILGHSERRHTIGHLEDDAMINRRMRAALKVGLTPILCVGETLAERDAGATLDVLTYQLSAGLIGLTESDSAAARIKSPAHLVVAYEPVWAIGTGRNATPDQAQEAHKHLRQVLRRQIGHLADEVRILYGGSLNAENAAAILAQPDVDGGLVGGASLKAESLLAIIRAAAR